jgi:alanyl-tRNA synthetase
LVFIQFNANADGSFGPLPQRHVDTGLGLERTTAIIEGTKNFTEFSGTVSNYETDIFRPIFDEVEELSSKKYQSTLPKPGTLGESDQEKIDIAFRVIADHIRTLSFAIADGIIPSNEGRGYVLRRILRRAVRYGRTLGFHEPFFFKLVDVVAKTMGDVFPEVRAKQTTIQETIRREEESFYRTLDRGTELFANAMVNAIKDYSRTAGLGEKMVLHLHPFHIWLESGPVLESDWTNVHSLQRPLPRVDINVETVSASELRQKLGGIPKLRGRDVFELYDTYGFPLDLTELMARERGLAVDVASFKRLMEEQRTRGRMAQKREIITMAGDFPPTRFVGYDRLAVRTKLFSIEGDYIGPGLSDYFAIVEESPLYAEMGGQVGDQGVILRSDGTSKQVLDTLKRGETFFLKLGSSSIPQPFVPNEIIEVKVDVDRRNLIQGHHTVTHVLHWALHEKVSKDATQKGSYVGPDKLTFDFSSAALSKEKVREVEKLVNEKVRENARVSTKTIPYSEAKKRSDIQQFFGDKYTESVRVVQIGGTVDVKGEAELNGYSMELCGGTHVRSTNEIGAFRIVREEAIAAGIRRIEAVAGDAARQWAKEEAERQQKKFEMLARKKSDVAALPVFEEDSETHAMLDKIDMRAAHLEKLEADVREWEKKGTKASEAQLKSRAAEIAKELATTHAAKGNVVAEVKDADAKLLQAVGVALKSKIKGPIFLVGASNGRVALLAVVPKELSAKLQANKLIQEIAPIVGGKGGGRPENAQGSGTDVGKIDTALAEAERLITATQL